VNASVDWVYSHKIERKYNKTEVKHAKHCVEVEKVIWGDVSFLRVIRSQARCRGDWAAGTSDRKYEETKEGSGIKLALQRSQERSK